MRSIQSERHRAPPQASSGTNPAPAHADFRGRLKPVGREVGARETEGAGGGGRRSRSRSRRAQLLLPEAEEALLVAADLVEVDVVVARVGERAHLGDIRL